MEDINCIALVPSNKWEVHRHLKPECACGIKQQANETMSEVDFKKWLMFADDTVI